MTQNLIIEASDLMLATRHPRSFSDPDWLFELKYDGFRCLAIKAGERVELWSRNGNPFNGSFPDIVMAISKVPGDFVWDAELTVDDDTGRPDFERLRQRAVTKTPKNVRAAAKSDPARLYVFDALSIDGADIRSLPLTERKLHLRKSFDNSNTLIYASGIEDEGRLVFEHVKELGLEGMIAKRLDSPYTKGRSRDWLKIKYSGYGRPAALGWGRK
ncbi:ATP-dependent DNA ligase [Paraburkholderia caledonica]|uniref:Bifunctional non-homologous end joining protein LigD n=1 Tax=Paraburkholderia caledonica TaxID=134536 RepID=A0AB73I3H6_9BURK|nr:bifunctional non-homologous end joining protein LigD [Paraburkholderia caledonica]